MALIPKVSVLDPWMQFESQITAVTAMRGCILSCHESIEYEKRVVDPVNSIINHFDSIPIWVMHATFWLVSSLIFSGLFLLPISDQHSYYCMLRI